MSENLPYTKAGNPLSSIIVEFILSSVLGDIIVNVGPIENVKKHVEKILSYKQITDVINKTQSDMAREGFPDHLLSEIFTEVDLSSEQNINSDVINLLEKHNTFDLYNRFQQILRLKFCGSGVNLQEEQIIIFSTKLLDYLYKNILQSDLPDKYKIIVLTAIVREFSSETLKTQEQISQIMDEIESLKHQNSPSKLIQGNFIPNHRDDKFVGRKEFLDEIFALIQDKNIIAIYGLAGIGKSSTALEFCYKFEKKFKRILWVNVESGLLNGFSTLSRQLGLLKNIRLLDSVDDALVIEFVNLLKDESTRDTLIIIDGFDNIDSGKDFDNNNKSWEICNGISIFNINAKIIILSRRKLSNRAFHSKKIDFLDSKSEKKLLNVEDDENAKNLADALYHIPLYLRVARVIIDKQKLTATKMLEILDESISVLEKSYITTTEIGYDKSELAWNCLFSWYWKLFSTDKPLKHLATKIAYFGNEVSVPIRRIELLSSEEPFLCSNMLDHLHRYDLFSIYTKTEVRLHSLIQKEILKLTKSQPIYKKEYQKFSKYYTDPNLLASEILSRNAQSIICDIAATHEVLEESNNYSIVISEELIQLAKILSNIEYIISQCNRPIDVIQNIREGAYRLQHKVILNKYSNFLLKQENSIFTKDCKNILETITPPKYNGHSDAVRSFIFWKDDLISSSDDGHIYIYGISRITQ